MGVLANLWLASHGRALFLTSIQIHNWRGASPRLKKHNKSMNLKELLAAKAALDAEIASARKIESTDALRRVHALVSDFGFTSQQVFPLVGTTAKDRKKSDAKFRNPETGASSTSRGKPPKWLDGKNRDDFLISETDTDRQQSGPFLAEMAAAAGRNRPSR